jgi:AcrR family transcriptional regulator
MSHIADSAGRPYRSKLRARQAEETRDRILDATVRLMADGMASLSIPAVAREAGVSVPTVYRHFGSRRRLLAALYPHVAHRAGLDKVKDPGSIDELRDVVRSLVDHLDSLDDLARAAFASPVAAEVRRVTRASRYERIRRLADSIDPPLREADRDRITRLLVVLISSATLRMWRDVLGSTGEEAADDVEWIVRAAIAASRREDDE